MSNQASEPKAIDGQKISWLKRIGPGLIVAATGVGAGDVVSGTVSGGNYGLVLLWAVAFGAFFKFVLAEGVGRWQLATGESILEGWANHMPAWVKIYFGIFICFWSVTVSAALASACGLGIETLTGGAVDRTTGAIAHSLIGFAIVWKGGFTGFEKIMNTLTFIMFGSIILCAAFIFQDPIGTLKGLMIPTIPSGSGVYVLSIMGGLGGTITLMSYNYWMREQDISGPAYLRYIRIDLSIAYILTGLFVAAVMVISNQAFHVPGVPVTDAEAVTGMAGKLSETLGPIGFYSYAIGFWAAVFTSLLGVWQSIPYIFADYYGVIRRFPSNVRKEVTKVTSTPYRIALTYMSLVPIPFILMGRPLLLIVIYTVVSSLFVPFLAGTILYLNNRVAWSSPIPRNSTSTNVVIVIVLLLFATVGVMEIMDAIG